MFPAAVSAIIYNDSGQLLLVSPDGLSRWRTVGGWLEQETIYAGLLREIHEELGPIDVRFMDILDAHLFDKQGTHLISVFGLVEYIQGEISTHDDIEGYTWRWFDFAELKTLDISCPCQLEIIEKADFLINAYRQAGDLPFLKYKWMYLS